MTRRWCCSAASSTAPTSPPTCRPPRGRRPGEDPAGEPDVRRPLRLVRRAGAGRGGVSRSAEPAHALSGGGPVRRRRDRLAEYLALERNVAAVSGTMFLMGLGEELWKRFVPRYLEALGAPVAAIGLYGTSRDLLDGVYQYPGGWVADRFGRRPALLLFVGLATVG